MTRILDGEKRKILIIKSFLTDIVGVLNLFALVWICLLFRCAIKLIDYREEWRINHGASWPGWLWNRSETRIRRRPSSRSAQFRHRSLNLWSTSYLPFSNFVLDYVDSTCGTGRNVRCTYSFTVCCPIHLLVIWSLMTSFFI